MIKWLKEYELPSAFLVVRKHLDSLSSPQAPKEAAEVEDDKNDFFPADTENVNYIVHLNDTTFDGFVAEHSQAPILTMFYAPCKYQSHAHSLHWNGPNVEKIFWNLLVCK